MIIEKSINEIDIGHFIVDIVNQQGTYSLTSSGYIKSEKAILILKEKGVLSVLIDTAKSLDFDDEIKPQDKSSAEKNVPQIIEVTKAKKIFQEAKKIQQDIFDDIVQGRKLNLTPVIEVTNNTINAIFKNPDSLTCIINIRKKDEYLLEHSISVSILLTIFARYLNIERQIIEQLAIGAFLHDIGKIKIPRSILNKRKILNGNEKTLIKKHVSFSIALMEQIPNISDLSVEIAALHHEKINGSGYPYGLVGDDISQYGRMITICDIFDALTANRPHKVGIAPTNAFVILRKLAEKGELDQQLVDTFIKCLGVYPVGSIVELNNNKLAIVEQKNSLSPVKPKVRAFYNLEDKRYVMAEDIDLTNSDYKIMKSVRADDYKLDMNKIVEFLLMEG